MDLFDRIAAGDIEGLADTLLADPGLARRRHASGASLYAWAHCVGQPAAAEAIAEALGELDPHDAVIAGDAVRVEQLLAAGWDGNQLSADGFPPLALAAFFSRDGVFELLLPVTTDVNRQAENDQRVAALHAATARANARMVEQLLRAGADPDLRQQGGFTPLHAAAQNGDGASAALLLLWEADRKLATDKGMTPAMLAREAGHHWLADRLD